MPIKIRDKKSNKQVIQELLRGERELESLTEAQEDYYNLLRATLAALLNVKTIYTTYEIIELLKNEYQLSESSAWRILSTTKQIFGDFDKASKHIDRMRAKNMALESYKIALEKKDARSMAAAAKTYAMAAGVDKEDQELPNFEKLDASLVVLVLPEEQKNLLQNALKGGVINLNQLPTQDIEHEEIS